MPDPFQLLVTNGPDAGRKIVVPPEGATLGRSSSSDITLQDPTLSRRHCRFETHEDGSPWVIDFGSANQTLVNDKPVTEQRLDIGDLILVGDTLLKLVSSPAAPSAAAAAAAAPAQAAAAPAETQPQPQTIDLGCDSSKRLAEDKKLSLRPILWVVAAAILLIAGWAVFMNADGDGKSKGTRPAPGPRVPRHVSIRYEKVEATTDNIFR